MLEKLIYEKALKPLEEKWNIKIKFHLKELCKEIWVVIERTDEYFVINEPEPIKMVDLLNNTESTLKTITNTMRLAIRRKLC